MPNRICARTATVKLSTLIAVGALLTVAACGTGEAANESTASTTQTFVEHTAASPAAAAVSAANGWVKATPTLTDHAMTGVFVELTNTSSDPVTIAAVDTSASPAAELHETVTDQGTPTMQKITAGLIIPAGQTRKLTPGGDHIMVMDLTSPIAVGSSITVTLTTSAGETMSFPATAKEFTGAAERYADQGAPTTTSAKATANPS